MAELHRLDRRLFLTDMGKRTIAIAVLGGGVLAACSSDGEITVESPATAEESIGSEDSTTTSATENSAATPITEPDVDASGEPLRWTRVVLGGVSAYLLARGSEVTIVDTGNPGSVGDIGRGLIKLGAGWGDVNNVILTHLHGDHIGGLPAILDQSPNAVVFAGRADAEKISSATVEALDDGDEIFGLQVIGTPGHTPGHIAVLDPVAGLMVAGDALNESNGMVLGPNPTYTPDMTTANVSVKRLAERQYETVVFGHGNPIETGGSDAVIALAQTLD